MSASPHGAAARQADGELLASDRTGCCDPVLTLSSGKAGAALRQPSRFVHGRIDALRALGSTPIDGAVGRSSTPRIRVLAIAGGRR